MPVLKEYKFTSKDSLIEVTIKACSYEQALISLLNINKLEEMIYQDY